MSLYPRRSRSWPRRTTGATGSTQTRRRMRRFFLAGTVAALAATVLLLGGVGHEATAPAAGGPAPDQLVAHAFQLQQRWRETADPTYLTRSEEALRRDRKSTRLNSSHT